METEEAALDRLVAAMSLEEQVGQVLMAALPGTELDPDTAAMLRDCHIGNVLLLPQNIDTPEQTRALTGAVEALCGRPGLPALIAADQEGGRVQRLKPPATSFPSAMAVGAAGDPEWARRWGLATGRELRAVGINTAFAPVLDVNADPRNPVIGTRSYGELADVVARFGLAAIAGLREGGVVAVGKHFPGHGDTHVDSHYALPTIAHGLNRLREVELPPFRAAIEAGVPGIMSSHIVFPALEPGGLPATLSRSVLTGLLREELGFGGVIVSDALNMRAVADGWGVPGAAVRFLAAGGDLIEALRDDRSVYAALLAAVGDGTIPRAQLTASVRRIARLKRWVADQGPGDPAMLGAPEHRAWAAAIARAAVTLLRDRAALLPMRPDTRLVVLDCYFRWTFGEAMTLPETSALADALRPHFPRTRAVVVDGRGPEPAAVEGARVAVEGADVVIVGTRGAARFPKQAAFVETVAGWGVPTIAVALMEPYDAAAYPSVPTVLATYGADPAMLDALGERLIAE